MAKLPLPDWLTMPAALAYLKGQDFGEDESKDALTRACRDGRIASRGRSKRWAGHDSQAPLYAGAWDQAEADWKRSVLVRRERWKQYEIADIELSRAHVDRWLASAGGAVIEHEAAPAPVVSEPAAPQGRADTKARGKPGPRKKIYPKVRDYLAFRHARESGSDLHSVTLAQLRRDVTKSLDSKGATWPGSRSCRDDILKAELARLGVERD